MHQFIIASNTDLVPFFDMLHGIFCPKFWDSPPYAFLAHGAFNLENLSDNDARSLRSLCKFMVGVKMIFRELFTGKRSVLYLLLAVEIFELWRFVCREFVSAFSGEFLCI